MLSQLLKASIFSRKVKYIDSLGTGQHYVWYNEKARWYSPMVWLIVIISFLAYLFSGTIENYEADIRDFFLIHDGKVIINKAWHRHNVFERLMRLYV